ncbi:MAG TPA: RagB/SusD family nutrient uptake outer membrane protein [Chitinophagaceae bacterium]|nr:RagB/SusD family nutrient uptake outer membrane protein [Chitinophagaceae bacterium]
MKKNKYKLVIIFCVALLSIVYACNKDFLDKPPQGALSAGVLANKQGVEGLLLGAYHMVGGEGGAPGNVWGAAASNWVYGSAIVDDSYKGSIPTDQMNEGFSTLATFTYATNNGYLNEKWRAMYDGVGRANNVLRVLPLAKDISAGDVTRITAEARFLRGHFHFEVKRLFNNIVYADEKTTETRNVDDAGAYIDYWPKIEADFQAAIDGLPETQTQPGRANKSAAKVYLARCYMEQHKYAQAKPLLEDVIANGKTAKGEKYALVNYQSNFNAQQDNSAESVWAYQASVNDGSGTNGNYGDNLQFPNGSGPGGCCGFNNPSINLANAYKTDGTTGLPLLDNFNSGISLHDTTATGALAYTGTLDPRIDIVMGRPTIPYYDWGVVPGPRKLDWIRSPADNGPFSPKKVVYAKSQVGSISSTETSFWGPTQMSAINVNLIRFAEVLLWAAECEIAIGTSAKALAYVNQVRNRAADPTGWVYQNSDYDAATGKYKTQTTPAANYKISPYPAGAFDDKVFAVKALLHEERLELAMEGQRFFTLRRFDNGTGLMTTILNNYIAVEKTRPSFYIQNPSVTFAPKYMWFPIPQAQIDVKNLSGTVFLKQNPGF